MRDSIQIVMWIFLSTGFNSVWVLAENSDIFFPGRTNTNTNSVVVELNRNNVQAFFGVPPTVDEPERRNPGDFSAVQRAPSDRDGNTNAQQSGHSITRPNIIAQNVPVTLRPLLGGFPSNDPQIRHTSSSGRPAAQSTSNAEQTYFVQPSPVQEHALDPTHFPSAHHPPNSYVNFAYELFANSKSGTRNLVLSPILTQASLALLQQGASGRTREDLRAIVQSPLTAITHLISSLKSTNSQHTTVEYVSTVFVSDDVQLNRTFAAIADIARSSVVPVNFRQSRQAVQIINSWVSQWTRRAIPAILDQNADTRAVEMLLANAIYFKSNWKYVFKSTEQGLFYKAKTSNKPLTYIRAKQYYPTGFLQTRGPSGGAHWVEIPYAGEEFSMVILVPQFRDTLLSLISELSMSHVQTIINQLGRSTRQLVDLKIPKFEIETRTSLLAALHDMGLGRLFVDPSELVYVNEGRPVKVGDCVHNAKLAVDETGTIAAAANAFSIIPLSISAPDPEVPFIVDQPFVALIVDRRNSYPLFIAKIFDP